jgi:hypothetical protein
VAPSGTCIELRKIVRDWVARNIPFEVVQLAEAEGHKVQFTAPYHSDLLQPIELVWALVKGNIGRQYNLQTTLANVYERLNVKFERLQGSGRASIDGLVEKCAKRTEEMYIESQQNDKDNDYDSDEDYDQLGKDNEGGIGEEETSNNSDPEDNLDPEQAIEATQFKEI